MSATSLLLSIIGFSYSAATTASRPSLQSVSEVKLFNHSSNFQQSVVLTASHQSLKSKIVARNSVTSTNAVATSTHAVSSPETITSSPASIIRNSVSPSVNSAFQQGVYVGPINPRGVKAFAENTNTNVTIASDYLPGNSGWSGLDGTNGSIRWLAGAWKKSGYTLSLGVPMIPTNSSGQPQGNIAVGATGAYNDYFVKLAKSLVAQGEGTAYLRLGWEFDGNWFAWQAQNAIAESEYASYFRQIVTSMRSVPRAAFKFVWNPDASAFVSNSYSVSAAYPGNSYVDVIGLDLYDTNWGTPRTPQAEWANNFFPQLSAAARFAKSRGKPIAIDEWSVVSTGAHGFGDDPYFINSMIKWMKSPSHDVAYESYFDGNTLLPGMGPDRPLLREDFPLSLLAFEINLS